MGGSAARLQSTLVALVELCIARLAVAPRPPSPCGVPDPLGRRASVGSQNAGGGRRRRQRNLRCAGCIIERPDWRSCVRRSAHQAARATNDRWRRRAVEPAQWVLNSLIRIQRYRYQSQQTGVARCAGGRVGAQLSPRNLQQGSFAKMPQREVTADSGQHNISGSNHSRSSHASVLPS